MDKFDKLYETVFYKNYFEWEVKIWSTSQKDVPYVDAIDQTYQFHHEQLYWAFHVHDKNKVNHSVHRFQLGSPNVGPV